jgi:hypothetical protein
MSIPRSEAVTMNNHRQVPPRSHGEVPPQGYGQVPPPGYGQVDRRAWGVTARQKLLAVASLLLALGIVSGCSEDPDQSACNDLYGGGYLPKTEDGRVYCENPWNGNRYLLRYE